MIQQDVQGRTLPEIVRIPTIAKQARVGALAFSRPIIAFWMIRVAIAQLLADLWHRQPLPLQLAMETFFTVHAPVHHSLMYHVFRHGSSCTRNHCTTRGRSRSGISAYLGTPKAALIKQAVIQVMPRYTMYFFHARSFFVYFFYDDSRVIPR